MFIFDRTMLSIDVEIDFEVKTPFIGNANIEVPPKSFKSKSKSTEMPVAGKLPLIVSISALKLELRFETNKESGKVEPACSTGMISLFKE